MKPAHPHPHQRASGFTLVEMLVSVAVLVLIMTFIAQMMNSATISTTLSSRHVDADAEARLVFDRMGSDFSRMSHRTDVDFMFAKQPDYQTLLTSSGTAGTTSGTDSQMFFYSEAPAYPASLSGSQESTVALIGYSINFTGTTYAPAYFLQRLSKGLTLNASPSQSTGASNSEANSMVFLTAMASGSLPLAATGLLNTETAVIGQYPTPPEDVTDYDLLSPEVFRMDVCFQVKDLSAPGAVGTVYSNFPCAFFNANATNKNTISATPPPVTPVNGPHPAVGDRYFDTQTDRAYVCTSLFNSLSSSGQSQTLPVWTPNGMADVNAIVVTIAIMDQRSRRILPPASDALGTICSKFLTPTEQGLNPKINSPSSTTPPMLAGDIWQNGLTQLLLPGESEGVPVPILGQVHIYQRFFYLNNN